jgi:WD40 repeat protein
MDHDNFSIAISPDGKQALTGGSDSNLHLWDLESGEELQVLSGHPGLLTSVAFSPDGSKALAADWAGRVLLWDLETGAQRLHVHGHQVNVAWTGGHTPPANAVFTSDSHQALSSAGDGTLVIWDLHDASEIRRFVGHEAPLSTVRFTPDGKYALTGSGRLDLSVPPKEDNSIKLWEVESGALLRVFEGHADTVLPLDVSQDGTRMLSGSRDGSVKLWDLESGEEIRSFEAQPSGVSVLSFSPDGRRAISGPVGPWPWEPLILWDLETGEVAQRIPLNDVIATSVEINPDGMTAYTAAGDLALIDLEGGKFIREYATVGRPCYDFALSPDRKSVFITGHELVEWDLETDQLIRKFWEHAGSRSQVEITPDGRMLLSSDAAGNLYLWDTQTGDQIRSFNSDVEELMTSLDITSDGRYAITPGGNGSAILWDLTLPIELEAVREWIEGNRYVRQPTCAERETFSIEPLCGEQ